MKPGALSPNQVCPVPSSNFKKEIFVTDERVSCFSVYIFHFCSFYECTKFLKDNFFCFNNLNSELICCFNQKGKGTNRFISVF